MVMVSWRRQLLTTQTRHTRRYTISIQTRRTHSQLQQWLMQVLVLRSLSMPLLSRCLVCHCTVHFLRPVKQHGICFRSCLSACNMITFESLYLESSFLVSRYIFCGYRSSLHMKVTGVRCDPATPGLNESVTAIAEMASPFQSFIVWCYLPVVQEAGACSAAHRSLPARHVACKHLLGLLLICSWPAGVRTSHFPIRRQTV